MSAREGIELRGHPNPDAVFRQINIEKALLDENMQKIQSYKDLRQSDPEAAEMYKMLVLGGNKSMNQGRGNGMMAESLGSFSDGGQGPGPDINTNTMSLPPLGMGQMGPTGRPPTGPVPGSELQGSDVGY